MIADTLYKRESWIEVEGNSDFPIQNIPFGIFKPEFKKPRVATIIGSTVIDVAALYNMGYLSGIDLYSKAFENDFLNNFIALGKPITNAVRERIMSIFDKKNVILQDNSIARSQILHCADEVEMCMPVRVGDYTDFYSSREHATNVGIMFRDPENALLPNWLHMPVGYHGRASSIIVSGTPIHRPKGQQIPADSKQPVFGASKLLDFELEMGFIIGKDNRLGDNISTADADDHIFGLALFNDWSARDIQKWEYVPLGPFLGKSFATTISPWIVTLEALDPFLISGPEQDPPVLPYLEYEGKKRYDINLSVEISTESGVSKVVSEGNLQCMYWNMAQQLAHHTINGCNMNVGDICASGTISGATPDSYGSMLELAWKGTKPIPMPDGTERKFIHDGDTVTMRGWNTYEGVRIGFGKVSAKILPVKE